MGLLGLHFLNEFQLLRRNNLFPLGVPGNIIQQGYILIRVLTASETILLSETTENNCEQLDEKYYSS